VRLIERATCHLVSDGRIGRRRPAAGRTAAPTGRP
jgi:hypothetical protein